MKASDAIAAFLAEHVRHVFTVSGGANLHIIDSIARRKDVQIICPPTEQAAAFRADAYARLTGFGCALATSGPGATNLLTGIAAAYYDSSPVLYLTGNQTRARLEDHGTRQYGFQATPIVAMAREVTKYAMQIRCPEDIMPILNEAVAAAREHRRGAVLVDIPDDIQRCNL